MLAQAMGANGQARKATLMPHWIAALLRLNCQLTGTQGCEYGVPTKHGSLQVGGPSTY